MRKHTFLIGFMGTGKSTISHKLRERMQIKEKDMDALIVRENEMSINEMFERFGEEYFRTKETEMLRQISGEAPAIVSCGGGTVLRQENVEIMKRCGTIVLLTASPETVYERVKTGKDRPILNGHMNVEYIAALMEKRRQAYEDASDISVATDGKTPDYIADEILKLLSE